MTYLKICGVRSHEDYKLVRDSKADYAGFIFAESKRKVTPQEVSTWIQKENHPKHVGVFVNPSIDELQETIQIVDLDVIQLHGIESPQFIKKVRSSIQSEIWKALPHTDQTLNQMEQYVGVVDGFIIDTNVKGKWGGTGIRFDWSMIPTYTKFCNSNQKNCLIAGGITSDNVHECLSYEPYGIDLSSGVESEEGKDPLKINELIERMNSYEHGISR